MKKLRIALVIAFLAIGFAALAQEVTPVPSPVPTLSGGDATPSPVPTPAGAAAAAFSIAAILEFARKHPLEAGAFLSGLIFGLRNVPWFADFFVKWPKFGVIVNAVTSLFVQVGACLSAGMTSDLPMCFLQAVGMFLSAAGVHGAIKMAGGQTSSGSATVIADSEGRLVKKTTGEVVDGPKTSRANVVSPPATVVVAQEPDKG